MCISSLRESHITRDSVLEEFLCIHLLGGVVFSWVLLEPSCLILQFTGYEKIPCYLLSHCLQMKSTTYLYIDVEVSLVVEMWSASVTLDIFVISTVLPFLSLLFCFSLLSLGDKKDGHLSWLGCLWIRIFQLEGEKKIRKVGS